MVEVIQTQFHRFLKQIFFPAELIIVQGILTLFYDEHTTPYFECIFIGLGEKKFDEFLNLCRYFEYINTSIIKKKNDVVYTDPNNLALCRSFQLSRVCNGDGYFSWKGQGIYRRCIENICLAFDYFTESPLLCTDLFLVGRKSVTFLYR